LACALLALGAAAWAAPASASASSADPYCTGAYGASDVPKPAPLRFGIDPELAGSVGSVQTASKPEDETKRLAALNALRPAGRELVLRVNRLFWSDGESGIRAFQQLIARDTSCRSATTPPRPRKATSLPGPHTCDTSSTCSGPTRTSSQ
jgi:hypothetical protein